MDYNESNGPLDDYASSGPIEPQIYWSPQIDKYTRSLDEYMNEMGTIAMPSIEYEVSCQGSCLSRFEVSSDTGEKIKIEIYSPLVQRYLRKAEIDRIATRQREALFPYHSFADEE
jgi:hypothetical protein